jgi:hypothetical protein
MGGGQWDEALHRGAQSAHADLPKGLFHGDRKQGQRQTVERVRRVAALDALREQRALLYRGIVWGWTCAASPPPLPAPPGRVSRRATTSAPGHDERAGKRQSGRTRKGSPWLRTALVEAAPAAAPTKHTALVARSRRLAARRGHQKAIGALAHALLVISDHGDHSIARRSRHRTPPTLAGTRRGLLPASRSRRPCAALGPPAHAPGLRGAAPCSADQHFPARCAGAYGWLLTLPFSGELRRRLIGSLVLQCSRCCTTSQQLWWAPRPAWPARRGRSSNFGSHLCLRRPG